MSGLETLPIVAATARPRLHQRILLAKQVHLPHTLCSQKECPAISDPPELGDDLEAYVSELVASGRYPSKDEVLRQGVRLIQQREGVIAALRLKYLQGIATAGRGDVSGAADILSQLRNDVAAMKLGRETEN